MPLPQLRWCIYRPLVCVFIDLEQKLQCWILNQVTGRQHVAILQLYSLSHSSLMSKNVLLNAVFNVTAQMTSLTIWLIYIFILFSYPANQSWWVFIFNRTHVCTMKLPHFLFSINRKLQILNMEKVEMLSVLSMMPCWWWRY